MEKLLFPIQFLKKRNIFLKKLRNPEFSLSELNYSFLLFSYPLVMLENYPRKVLMKIEEVVIFLEIFDFFQKKKRFSKKSKKIMFFRFSPFKITMAFMQLNKSKHLNIFHIHFVHF